ncbi:MAG: hypothetical protein C5B59_14610 [Bacteroidetes bacterium]|nr:MAG: hypothetical protein C5B59_14610 [Bacteroidota bacterium]
MHCCKIGHIFLFTLVIIGCRESLPPGSYTDPPLLYAAPWVLCYTDTLAISGSNYQVVRIPASGCILTDTIKFLENNIHENKYLVTGSCGPSLNGIWAVSPEIDIISYSLPTDTLIFMRNATIKLLTKDSMTLIQQASFRNPDSTFANWVTSGYSH